METITITVAVFWFVAFVASLFYGVKAVPIFQVTPQKGKDAWAWWLHQFWLNFIGSVVGWVALWFVGRKVISCLGSSCGIEPSAWDILVFFLAFVGIAGFLPVTIVGIATGFKELVVKLAGFYEKTKLPSSQVKYVFTVKPEVYAFYKKKAYNRLSAEVKIPGFRPGMAPANMTEAYLGGNLIEETINMVLQEVAVAVLTKENIQPLDQVKYDVEDLAKDNSIKFSVTFTVYPEVKLPDFKKNKVEKEKVDISKDDVEKVLNQMLEEAKKEEKDEGGSSVIGKKSFISKVP